MATVQRFTIGFEQSAMNAIDDVIAGTNYKTVPDVVRAAISTFVDLLDAEDQNFSIILRDGAGAEWKYSPHKPGRALPVHSGPNQEVKVIRPRFGDAVRSSSEAVAARPIPVVVASNEKDADRADIKKRSGRNGG